MGASPDVDVASLDRVLLFLRAMLERVADELVPFDAGWVARTPSLSAVWGINQVIVDQPLPFGSLLGLADAHLAGVSYRQITFEHQNTGPGLETAFRAAGGWRIDREVLMVLAATPDREADTSVVIDAGEDEMLELMWRWHREGRETAVSDAELDQLVEFGRRETRLCGDRLFGVRSTGGQLVTITKLRSDGRTAQVEDVYTVPEARGRGFARACVSHAGALARAAGHDLVFITADDFDWPQRLYERIGFRPIGRRWLFHRG